MTMLEEIRARDAETHYCATCTGRVYFRKDGKVEGPHGFTVEECEARAEAQGRKPATLYGGESPEKYGPKLLCWDPSDHHPFVEGEIPDYEQAEADRRFLLRELDRRGGEE